MTPDAQRLGAALARAGPEGKGRITEARERLARLVGTPEGLPVTEVKR